MKYFNNFLSTLMLVSLAFSLSAQGEFFNEDFDGGLPDDWTALEVTGDGQAFSNWEHTTVGPTGAFAIAALMSTTADNGWMIFDGDANCSGSQEAWLISPAIDCSDKESVFLVADNYYRRFQDVSTIMVGTDLDDTANWTEYTPFENVAVNSWGDGAATGALAANPQVLNVDITADAAGVNGVYFAFRFVGTCDYSWQVDDVRLTETDPRPANDMRVNTFFATATTAVAPLNQTDSIYFLADIENIGADEQTNVNLQATVEFNGATVFDETLAYGNIISDSLAENQLFPQAFLPTEEGLYDVTYTLTSDAEDEDPENNTRSYQFVISDTLFARNLTASNPNRPGWNPGDDHVWAYGTTYFVRNGAGNFSRYLNFNVGQDSDVGESIIFTLYQWEDANDDRNVDPDERLPLGFILYEVDGTETDNTTVSMPFQAFGGNDNIELLDNTLYAINMEYTPTDITTSNIEIGFAQDLDYGATDFLHGQFLGNVRLSNFLTILPDLQDVSFGNFTFGSDTSPALNWSIGESLPSSVDQTLPLTDKVEVNPNPAVDYANVNFDLDEVSSEVEVKIFDASARLLSVQKLNNVSEGSINVDVSNYQPGQYFVSFKTDKGFAARHLTVIK